MGALSGLCGGVLLSGCRRGEDVKVWRGVVMGIEVTVSYVGDLKVDRALESVLRVEGELSLWLRDSALSQLNRDGYLRNPPRSILDCLKKCEELYQATDGLFDPTIESYLGWMRERFRAGDRPSKVEREEKLQLVDFRLVSVSDDRVEVEEGVRLNFNAMAQGYLTDLLWHELGQGEALVNLGEYRVLGNREWPVIVEGDELMIRRALAVSSGAGERLSATDLANHLIDPKTGGSPPPRRVVAVQADEAWLADGLATVVAVGGEVPDGYQDVDVRIWE